MNTIKVNLAKIQHQIDQAERLYGRQPGAVQLLAASKQQTVSAIAEAMAAGQYVFGENYVQEALPKIQQLHDPKLAWHFIGVIQANKTVAIAQNFHWVHSVDRLTVAERLSAARPADQTPLNICLQVNLDNEAQKAGVTLAELMPLALAVSQLPQLKLRGLMAIPAPQTDFAAQRAAFRQVRLALEQLNAQGLNLDTLSMGMSADFSAAIAEGATIVRIGTAIFGPRARM